mmetsp:Transcript_59672/g.155188  ORF Transcript_59672/g.155188 Transcript_59672/m.155188 type:complete len:225 (-) Transcript_59672:7-681(-)
MEFCPPVLVPPGAFILDLDNADLRHADRRGKPHSTCRPTHSTSLLLLLRVVTTTVLFCFPQYASRPALVVGAGNNLVREIDGGALLGPPPPRESETWNVTKRQASAFNDVWLREHNTLGNRESAARCRLATALPTAKVVSVSSFGTAAKQPGEELGRLGVALLHAQVIHGEATELVNGGALLPLSEVGQCVAGTKLKHGATHYVAMKQRTKPVKLQLAGRFGCA